LFSEKALADDETAQPKKKVPEPKRVKKKTKKLKNK
jgi:hypothetical protein